MNCKKFLRETGLFCKTDISRTTLKHWFIIKARLLCLHISSSGSCRCKRNQHSYTRRTLKKEAKTTKKTDRDVETLVKCSKNTNACKMLQHFAAFLFNTLTIFGAVGTTTQHLNSGKLCWVFVTIFWFIEQQLSNQSRQLPADWPVLLPNFVTLSSWQLPNVRLKWQNVLYSLLPGMYV